ncbi:MAG: hypothetical protein KGZ58_06650, partial [Ignavibacteriales bacterium]|nr:hypothetical protein [Ignavibacteriales bacterium]
MTVRLLRNNIILTLLRKIQSFVLFAAIVLIFQSNVYAQLIPNLGGQRAGISSFQFLKIGVGARGSAMGESFIAVVNDASALYWNPAGIAHI